jgi:hypothetical protein
MARSIIVGGLLTLLLGISNAQNRSIDEQYSLATAMVGKSYWLIYYYSFHAPAATTPCYRQDVLLKKMTVIKVEKTVDNTLPLRFYVLVGNDTLCAEGSMDFSYVRGKQIMPLEMCLATYDYPKKHWSKKSIECVLDGTICEGMDNDALISLMLGYDTDKHETIEEWEGGGIYTVIRRSKEYSVVVRNKKVAVVTWHDKPD